MERRSHDRKPAFNVRASFRAPSDTAVVDLAPKGFGIETTSWLAVGTPYRIRLEVVGEPEPIYLQGVVDWCTIDRTEGRGFGETTSIYRAGIELLAMEARSNKCEDSTFAPFDSRGSRVELLPERRAASRVPLFSLQRSNVSH